MGNGRARTMGAKAHGFHPVAPRCVRATRWGRASVTQGGLVSSIGKVWLEIVRHSQTKRRETGNAKPGLKPPMVGADRSASEIPTEAVPGVGSGRSTQERGQSKRPRIAAGRAATPVGSKRSTGGGRPRAVWQRRRATRG